MTRLALATAALLIATAGASPPQPSSGSGAAGCLPAPPADLELFSGRVDVMVAGERRPRCGLRLRVNHGARALAAGPDGLLYVAEDSSAWDDTKPERRVDTGAVDVFRADGRLVRRLIDGVVGPSALAVDDRNRLFVLNAGFWMDRGKAAKARASIAIFEPQATAPSRTFPLLSGEKPVELALTPDGDAIVGDALEYTVPDASDGRVSRYRASDGTRTWSIGVPHPSLRTPHEITGMNLHDLRVLGTQSVVALYGSADSGREPFFVELAQRDGRLVRKVAVPKASALAIDRGGRVVVANASGVLAFAPGAAHGVRTAAPAAKVIARARDGALWYKTDTSILGFDAGGQPIATFGGSAPIALVDAPRTSAPLSDETPRPSPVPLPTPRPPTLADVIENVRGANGIAYDRLMVRGYMAPPAVDIGWSAAQRLAPGDANYGATELVHVAILGPYARLENRDASVVEIIDCVHRTVTSLSPHRNAARYDLPQRTVGPEDHPEPINGPLEHAHVTIETRREDDTSIDSAHVELYSIATGATRPQTPSSPAQRFEISNERVAIGELPQPTVACTGSNIGPAGLFPAYDWAFGNWFAGKGTYSFASEGAHVTRLGPNVPSRFEVAHVASGRSLVFAIFSGHIRALSDRDAALFAVPPGTRLDRLAPTF
jgi:hypothetical protein